MDGYWSKLVNVVSGMQQGSVLGPLLFLLYTSDFFSILENKLIGYADDSTSIALVPSQVTVKVTVSESLLRDLGRDSGWWGPWRMKLKASKTKTMIVCRWHKMHRQSPPLTIGRTVLKESDDLNIPCDIWFKDDIWEASSLCFHNTVLNRGALLPTQILNYWTV